MSSSTSFQRQALHSQKLAKTQRRRQAFAAERRVAEATTNSRRNDLLPSLQVRMAPIGELKVSPHRTRTTTPEQLERLIKSIGTLGINRPLLVRAGEIIDGHVCLEAARRMGLAQVPVIDCDHLSAIEARQLRLALNRTAETGQWDLGQLKIELAELIELDVDLSATGFTLEEQDIILLDDEAADEDTPVAGPEVVVSRLGDLWQLGDHRIVCGSALDEDVLAVLLGDTAVHAIIADFPYNVAISGNVSGLGKTHHGEFVMASGEMDVAQFSQFLADSVAVSVTRLVPGGVMFGWMDWRSIHLLYAAGFAAGLDLLNLVVWYKESGGMGGFYRSAHELIAVFCKGDTPRVNNIRLGKHGRDRTNVWSMPGANRRGSSANAMLASHATPKPVELCVDAILDVTRRGDAVLDPFLGSGTTLIAAEKTGRRGFGIELDPKFVDVAVRRWQALTGVPAVLVGSDESFAAVEAARNP